MSSVLGLNLCLRTVRVVDIILKVAMQFFARLSAIILLIAIAYTSAIIHGISIRTSKVERYICRPKETCRIQRRHSNFWVGLYGQNWLNNLQLRIDWVGTWMRNNRNKRLYYQRGLRAIDLIQPTF